MSFLIRQTLIYAIPLMIVALAGIFAERSGVINLALEGIMIFGAFIGVLFVRILQATGCMDIAKEASNWAALQGYMFLTMLAAAALGALFSMLLAFAAIKLKADQTIGGTALNMLAPALVLFLIRVIVNQNNMTLISGDSATWFMIKKTMLGFAKNDKLNFFQETFLNKVYLSTYICIIIFIVLSIVLYKTRFGLRLRACGEHPQAADSVGVNVYRMRYAGVAISGALAGVGGLVFVVPTSTNFNATVAGYGFLALAVLIFGQWRPSRILFAAFFFGLMKTVASAYSGIPFLANLGIPNDVYKMVPYVATLIVLAFTSKNSMAPRAEGIPYDKGSR